MQRAMRLAVSLGMLLPAPLSAQAPAAPPAQAAKAAAPASAPASAAAIVEPKGYTYDPAGRRDPFVSLLRRGTGNPRQSGGARPAGLAGLGAGEVSLKGTLASHGEYVALLEGADARTYVVRPGDRLLDGTVRAITADSIVILQQVDDPLSREKMREVRKLLRQTEVSP